MRTKYSLTATLFSAVLLAGTPSFAQHDHHSPSAASKPAAAGKLVRVTEKDAAWAAKARANYPIDVCVTSDEKLGTMGKSPEYIYRVQGQPDRLVMFCCDGCEEDFMKEPAKYVAKLDAAAKAKAAPAAKSEKARAHQHE